MCHETVFSKVRMATLILGKVGAIRREFISRNFTK